MSTTRCSPGLLAQKCSLQGRAVTQIYDITIQDTGQISQSGGQQQQGRPNFAKYIQKKKMQWIIISQFHAFHSCGS